MVKNQTLRNILKMEKQRQIEKGRQYQTDINVLTVGGFKITNMDFSDEVISHFGLGEIEFIELNFSNVNFMKGYFDFTTFYKCSFENCKFETVSVKKESIIEGCTFKNCYFKGFILNDYAKIDETDFYNCSFWQQGTTTNFKFCSIENCSFINTTFNKFTSAFFTSVEDSKFSIDNKSVTFKGEFTLEQILNYLDSHTGPLDLIVTEQDLKRESGS